MDTSRLHQIKSLPDFMQDEALVDWDTTAALFSTGVPAARKIVKDNGITIVALSERKRLPRWGALRAFLQSRETVGNAAA